MNTMLWLMVFIFEKVTSSLATKCVASESWIDVWTIAQRIFAETKNMYNRVNISLLVLEDI